MELCAVRMLVSVQKVATMHPSLVARVSEKFSRCFVAHNLILKQILEAGPFGVVAHGIEPSSGEGFGIEGFSKGPRKLVERWVFEAEQLQKRGNHIRVEEA